MQCLSFIISPLMAKNRAYRFQFLYALMLLLYLILIDMIDYANCMTSDSISFMSLSSNSGKYSLTSSM